MLFPDDDKINRKPESEYNRLTVPYENKSEKFRLRTNEYSKQYYHVYTTRLSSLMNLLEEKAVKKWGKAFPIKKLCDLREEKPEKCIVVGTVYKHQEFKPSVLKEISEENQLAPQPPRMNYTDDGDKLILEDDLQRILLIGTMNVETLVTGLVCAVLEIMQFLLSHYSGYAEADGKFFVEDHLFYECGPQKPLKELDISPLLVLISGLDQSSNNNFNLSLEILQQWMFGNYDGFGNIHDWEAANIVRIIVAGNSVRSTPETKEKSLVTRKVDCDEKTLESVKLCDTIFANWTKSVYVDIMPGEFDPSNFLLPQQPLHHCMFPKSHKLNSCQSVTNPYSCEIADRSIIGTSGQNVVDIMRVSKIEDPLEALRSTLVWSHIAPTCPDTLPCYPYTDKDPFILFECPHIYFCGNQNEFKTDINIGQNGNRTRLICIPNFSKTQSIAVVNLRTLECKEMSFQMPEFEE